MSVILNTMEIFYQQFRLKTVRPIYRPEQWPFATELQLPRLACSKLTQGQISRQKIYFSKNMYSLCII